MTWQQKLAVGEPITKVDTNELASALQWTLKTLKSVLARESVRDADEVIEHAESVLKQWERQQI